MACVVGIQGEDVVYIGSDGVVFKGGQYDEFMVGASEEAAEALKKCLAATRYRNCNVCEYMKTSFLEMVKQYLSPEIASSFLVSHRTELFEFLWGAGDFRVMEKSVSAVGNGGVYALGALYALEGDPGWQVLRALETVSAISLAEEGAFMIGRYY